MTTFNPYLLMVTALLAAGACHDSAPSSRTTYPQPASSQGDDVTPAEWPELTPLEEPTSTPDAPAAENPRPAATPAPALVPVVETAPTAAVPSLSPSPAATPSAQVPSAPAEAAAPPAQSIVLTDEQILRVIRVFETADVKDQELAVTKARNKRVKEFATRMLTQQTKARHRGVLLATKTSITPEDSSMSDAVASKQKSVFTGLNEARLTAFDNAYLAAQVQRQQDILELLASELMPAATNSDLTAELQQVRSTAEAQLAEAKALQEELTNATTLH